MSPAPSTPPASHRALELEEGLGFRLDRVQRALRAGWAAALVSLDLTPPLAALLRAVRDHPCTSVRGLARLLGTDAMRVKRGVDELEARRLVRAIHQPGDRRPRCVELTPGGKRVVRQLDGLVREREATFDVLGDEQRRRLEEVVAVLEQHLGIGAGDDGEPVTSEDGRELP